MFFWLLYSQENQALYFKFREIQVGTSSDNARSILIATPGTSAHTSGDITGYVRTEKQNFGTLDIERVRRWRQNCFLNHPECNRTLSHSTTFDGGEVPLPARCIDVERHLLCETKGKRGNYLILSHRWTDETSSASTVKSNYDCKMGRCVHISCDNLAMSTPLFLDIGRLARDFNITYVWIDSVCIIQDDTDDWDQESVKMAEYYQNAWLTVQAAATAPGKGLVREIDKESFPEIARLPYRNREGDTDGYMYLQGNPSGALYDTWREHHRQNDIFQRGWVYQEVQLSRRILRFTEIGCFLLCNVGPMQTTTGEELHKKRDLVKVDPFDVTLRSYRDIYELHRKQVADWAFDKSKAMTIWRGFVQDFSKLDLKYLDQDRLIALAGIAAEFGNVFERLHEQSAGPIKPPHPRYTSGHWFPDCDLLWEQAEPSETATIRLKGLPTWSWASIGVLKDDGIRSGLGVRWPEDKRDLCVQSLCTPTDIYTVTVNQKHEWKPIFDSACPLEESAGYGNEARFTMLRLQGRIHRVYINGTFDSDLESKAVKKLTGYGSENEVPWRSVAISQSSEYASGWASVEWPSKPGREDVGGMEIYALHVDSIQLKPNIILSLMGQFKTAHKVLYLTPTQIPGYERCFQRVGAGRLFGNEMLQMYELTQESDIWLV